MRKKVRLVVKGFMEVWGEDFWNTYSPTLGCDTLFSSLAYAANLDLEIHQMDAITTYLNSPALFWLPCTYIREPNIDQYNHWSISGVSNFGSLMFDAIGMDTGHTLLSLKCLRIFTMY